MSNEDETEKEGKDIAGTLNIIITIGLAIILVIILINGSYNKAEIKIDCEQLNKLNTQGFIITNDTEQKQTWQLEKTTNGIKYTPMEKIK